MSPVLTHAILLERCRQVQTQPDFPRTDLGQIFSTSDGDDRDYPVQEITDFILDTFDGEASDSRQRLEALPGALSLVENAISDLASLLSPIDYARLGACRGHLLQALAYRDLQTQGLDLQKMRAAIEAFRDASSLLPPQGPPSVLRRHFAWRAANLSVELGDQENAAALLQVALAGPVQYATERLYFQCATRLLRLTPSFVHQVLHVVQPDLMRAWVRLPAKRMLKSSRGRSHETRPIEPLAEEPSTSVYADSRSEWDPRDRLSICILLLYIIEDPLRTEMCKKEALALMSCFRRVRGDHLLDRLRRALENAPLVS